MGNPRFGAARVALVALLALVALPSPALAHTVMMTPTPRDVGVAGSDAHKTGPCGGVKRTNKCTQIAQGAQVSVKWMETVSHRGCFQWLVSSANDESFVTLKQINDPTGGQGMVYTDTIQLPAGLKCENCTLAVRQLMTGAACVPDASAPTETYYSCADVRIGDYPAATPCSPPPATDGGPTEPPQDSGVGTVPTDGGGKLVDASAGEPGTAPGRAPFAENSAGCNLAVGATSGVSFVVTAGLLAVALVRRRRRAR